MSQETRTIAIEPEIFRLRVLQLKLPDGAILEMKKTALSMGSSPQVGLSIPDGSVSRRHAVIEATPGGYRIRDLGSKNGTFINGIQIQEAIVPLRGVLKLGQIEVPFAQTEGLIDVALSRRTEVAGMVGQSAVMREIFATLERIGPTHIPVLLHGESGTGKELAARAIHQFSFSHEEAPFVVFDCSAVQRGLLESALFGHEEGAFSGAVEARPGAMELAAGGTLFIDEIGELDSDMQPKLLRALDKGEFRRVGGTTLQKSSARIVAATHHDLEKSVEDGSFRHDLFFRLAGMKVEIPPLRERTEDIPLLVQHLLEEMGERAMGIRIPYDTMEALKELPWNGNVRELKNALERAVILSSGSEVEQRVLPLDAVGPSSPTTEVGYRLDLPFKDSKALLLEQFERTYWREKLDQSNGNISHAARLGGIHRKSLEYLLRKLDLSPKSED